MGKKGKKGLSKKPEERTIKSMANAVSSDEGEADGQDMVRRKKRINLFDAIRMKVCNCQL